MKRMTKMKSVLACVCAVLMIALAVVPMFTLSASAAEATASISFANTTSRVSWNSSKQVWANDGLTVTNDKSSSTSNIIDSSNPVRFYANSALTFEIAEGNITKIVVVCGSSSYATALKNSVGAEAVASGSNVTITLTNPAQSYKIAKLTAQVRVQSLTVTYTENSGSTDPDTPACEHDYKTVTVNPTCTATGSETKTCTKCDDVTTSTIPALGHDLDEGQVTTPATCSAEGVFTKTCQRDDCNHTETSAVAKVAHNYVSGACSVCGASEAEGSKYEGSYYIAAIRSSGNYFYMTNGLGTASTKRYQIVDSGLKVLPESILATDVVTNQIFTIEAEGAGYVISTVVDGVTKYLYWTSGNSGNLTTSKNSATIATIEDAGSGCVNIHFAASDAERYLALNENSSNNYFAWYKSGQKQNLTLIPVVTDDGEEEVLPEIKSAALNIGDDLTMNYRVVLPEGADTTKYSMTFTLNEKTVTVTSCKAVEDGYVFAFEGIAPQLMGDTIVAKLLCDGAEVATVDYSVKQYVVDTMKGASDKLVTLLSDLLAYGAAAQTYRNYKTNNLVNVNVDGYAPSSATPVLADKVTALTENTSDVASLTAVGVYFDYTNKIYVKLNASTLEGVVVKVNGTAVNVEAYGNGYIAYSDAVSALDFGTAFTVTLEVDGEVAQTLTYSINSYVYTKCENADAELTAMQSLALALYRYGASALAYKA